MTVGIIVLLMLSVVGVGVVVFLVGLYNQLVLVTVNVDKAWANIDVLLKQRFDEIPKLVAVCEGYMAHERATLEKVTLARTAFLSSTTPGQAARAENQLSQALKTLFAVSENYPQLKANEHFLQLQQRVSYLENQIADRREFFNESVAIYNTRIRQVPEMFIAQLLRYQPREMFAVADTDKKDPVISFKQP